MPNCAVAAFTRRERAALRAELAAAIAEQAKPDREFDLALKALHPIERSEAA